MNRNHPSVNAAENEILCVFIAFPVNTSAVKRCHYAMGRDKIIIVLYMAAQNYTKEHAKYTMLNLPYKLCLSLHIFWDVVSEFSFRYL